MLFLVKLLRLENMVIIEGEYSGIHRPRQNPLNGFLLKIWLTLEKHQTRERLKQ